MDSRAEERSTEAESSAMSRATSKTSLGLFSAAALVVANMVGSGVFTTSGYALADLGSPWLVLAAWVICGFIAICGALSYGALVRRWPESGGEYVLLARTLHPMAGFLAGWVSLIAGFTAPIAVAGHGLAAYLGPWVGEGTDPRILGTAAIALAVGLHGAGGRGVLVQNVAVVLKLVAILLLVLVGLWMGGDATSGAAAVAMEPAPFRLGAFAVSIVWISFSYSGWNAAAYVAGEVREPQRNLSRSLFGGAALVMVLYIGLNAVFLFSAPQSELVGRANVGAIAAEAIGGASLRDAVSALVALALFTSISGMVMAGPRVYAKMAEDGLFPLLPGGESGVGRAVLLQGTLAIAVLWISGLRELLGYVGFTLGISAAATVIGLFVQRSREGAERIPVPGYPFVPLIYVVTTLGASAFVVRSSPEEAAWGLGTVAIGVPIYLFLRRA